MPSIAVDTGPLIALFDRDDAYHRVAVQFFEREKATLVTNLPVMTEAVHILSFSNHAAQDCLRWVVATFVIDRDTTGDAERIIEVIDKYANLPADFADASLLAMCERRQISRIATFDKDFDVYRLARGKRLRNALAQP